MEVIDQASGDGWQMYLGDSCQVTQGLPDNSIDYGIHSPPFANLYIYSSSEADMGNCRNEEEFIEHYKFLIAQLYRITVPGRLCSVHCKDLPKYANRDDTAGLKDFPAMIRQAFEDCGWSYHSRVTVWKCPVTERERTNNNGLLHKTIMRDRSQVRQGMADFLLTFRKPPASGLMSDKPVVNFTMVEEQDELGNRFLVKKPVGFTEYIGEVDPSVNKKHPSPFSRSSNSQHADGKSIDVWQRYADPVWWDIDQMDVLNYRTARGDRDERHICPLQVQLIERAVNLWSNPDDVVLSPFAGIGSEGVGSIRQGRKFVGIELKEEYYHQAINNLKTEQKKLLNKMRQSQLAFA